MTRIVQLPNRARAREEAARWLARVDRGLDDGERAAIATWVAADPLHRQELLQLAALWDDLDVLGELAALFPLARSETGKPRPAHGPADHGAARIGLKAAAAVALAACGTLFATALLRDGAPEPDSRTAERRFVTDVGVYETRQLPDGSIVTLNTDTDVRIDFTDAARNVYLAKGEAHFVVTHDPDMPFLVHAGGRILHAIGTAFNVHLGSSGHVEVTVTEGKVKVTREKGFTPGWTELPRDFRLPDDVAASPVADATLVAGEAARFDRNLREILRLEPMEIDIKLAWQRGMLIFRGEPLADILAEVSRYTTAEFVLADGHLGDVRVGGNFQAGDVPGLLLALRENFQIDSEMLADDRIVLRSTH